MYALVTSTRGPSSFSGTRLFRAALLPAMLLAACATSQKTLDETSAAQHLADAAKERADASREKKLYDPNVVALHPEVEAHGPNVDLPDTQTNPTARHLDIARADDAHARQHEEAAAKLENFEAEECRSIPPQTRAACPMLGPVAHIADIEKGVRLDYAGGTDIQPVVALMRCHLAYARERGYGTAAGCPLYMRGVDIRLSRDGKSVELTASDSDGVKVLRERSREMVPHSAR